MRVLMISWDYPPSGAATGSQVGPVSEALAALGHAVTVVTRHGPGSGHGDVRVVRAPDDPPSFPSTSGPLAHTMAVNHTLTRTALAVADDRRFDVVHAAGWLVTQTAVTVKEHLGVPLVATMRATEAGRNRGFLPEETNRTVHSVETWLGAEAGRLLVPSDYMRWEVSRLFDVPPHRVDTVPLGIDPAQWTVPARVASAARLRFAGEGPLVVFAGRLAPEKGVGDLLTAAATLRLRHPGTRFVIAGDGPERSALIEQSRVLKLHRAVSFPGHLPQETLAGLFAAADAVVLPSRYEPAGTVALEAAAAGAPLAAASTGGHASLVEPGVTGLRFPAGDPRAIAESVSILLTDHVLARALADRARRAVLETHTFPVVAAATAAAYEAAIEESATFAARRGTARTVRARRAAAVPAGNLLVGAPPVPTPSPDAVLATSQLLAAYDDATFDAAMAVSATTDDDHDAAWAAGVRAGRAAVRAELDRAAASREALARDAAACAAAEAFDVLLAPTQRQ